RVGGQQGRGRRVRCRRARAPREHRAPGVVGVRFGRHRLGTPALLRAVLMAACERLRGRVAVVTGAGSGIGLASARRLADEGARVVAVDGDEASGRAAAAELDGLFVRADVSSEEDVRGAFAEVYETCGAIDVSFHNAGVSPPADDSILTTATDV